MNQRRESRGAQRIQDKRRMPSGFKSESHRPGAHDSGASFSAEFRTSRVGRGGWRRLAREVVRVREDRHTPGLFAWRPGDESQPKFACVPGSEGIPELPEPKHVSLTEPMYNSGHFGRPGTALPPAPKMLRVQMRVLWRNSAFHKQAEDRAPAATRRRPRQAQ
jgi:hypothetical protein